jgi:hypothetical protein
MLYLAEIVLGLIVIAMYYSVFFSMNIKLTKSQVRAAFRSSLKFTVEEMEEIKQYATAFGISNDMEEADAVKLLELGRKLSAHIGNEKFIEFLDLIESEENSVELHTEHRSEHHAVNALISATELLVVVTPSFIKINKSFGGDKNGEPTSTSSY